MTKGAEASLVFWSKGLPLISADRLRSRIRP